MPATKRLRCLLGLVLVALVAWHSLPASAQTQPPTARAEPPIAWVARYSGPAMDGSNDIARALAVDASGNVYVTGLTAGQGTKKYDPNGNLLWEHRFNGTQIAVDAEGGVYVSGLAAPIGISQSDFVTTKFDAATGGELWTARYTGRSGSFEDAPSGPFLAVDASGHVYVAGYSSGAGTNLDYITIQYDAQTGGQNWVRRYNNNELNSGDYPTAIAADNTGGVYVTGTSVGRVTGFDYATVKYDSRGNEAWVKRFHRGYDVPRAIGVDGAGHVYVTGNSGATVKYDGETGTQLWVALFNGGLSGEPSDLAVDASGNVYVTGSLSTVKYDTNGNLLWDRRDGGGEKVALDDSGNVYVTRQPNRASGYVIVKYDAEGNLLWVARDDGPVRRINFIYDLAVDASGNVYLTGSSEGGPLGAGGTGNDYTTVKYAAVANLRVSVAGVQATGSGLTLTLRLENAGDAPARQALLTGATLAGGGQTAQDLPLSLGDLAPGGVTTATLSFAGAFPSGAQEVLRLQGSFAGGAFSASRRLTLP